MGGRGSSGSGGQQNAAKGNAVKGIALLQGAVSKARTSDLMLAYSQLQKKNIRQMTNEEKMVRAVAQDELANRGALIYDAKTEEFHKNTGNDRIIFDADRGRSYRILNVHEESYGRGPVKAADAEMYWNGKWLRVKNDTIRIELAKKIRRKK